MTWVFNPGLGTDGVVTVEVQGTPVSAALLVLAEDVAQLTSAGTTVVVDLDGLVLTSSSAMRGFIAALDRRCSGGDVVLACRRPTGRQLLRRWAAGSIRVVAGGSELALAGAATDGADAPAS